VNNKTVLSSILIFVLGISLGAYVVYALPGSTFYISSGVYPGGPMFTIYQEDSTYYAKNAWGQNVYSGSEAHTVINNAYNDLTSGRTWKEKVLILGDITLNNQLAPKAYTITEIRGKLTQNVKNISAINILYSHNEIFGGEIVGRKKIGDDDIMNGGIRARGFGNPISDISIHDITITNYYQAGVWIRDNCSNIEIYSVKVVNCTWGICALGSLGPANSWNIHELYINDILGYDNDKWTISLDREIENFVVNNVVSYKGSALAIAGARHGVVSNCVANGSDPEDSNIPGYNVETTPGWGECYDISYVNCDAIDITQSAWQVINVTNIQWANCQVFNCSKNAWVVEGSNNLQFVNCNANETGNHGFTFWAGTGNTYSNLDLSNCRVENIGWASGTWNGFNYGITHAGYSSMIQCHAFNCDNEGISYGGSGGTIRINLCYNDTTWIDSFVG